LIPFPSHTSTQEYIKTYPEFYITSAQDPVALLAAARIGEGGGGGDSEK